MIQAISLSGFYGTDRGGGASVGAEAQLARLQKELSECVNCPSSKTPEGKAKIQAITAKIAVVEARLKESSAQVKGVDEQQAGSKVDARDPQRNERVQPGLENRPVAGAIVGSNINTSA